MFVYVCVYTIWMRDCPSLCSINHWTGVNNCIQIIFDHIKMFLNLFVGTVFFFEERNIISCYMDGHRKYSRLFHFPQHTSSFNSHLHWKNFTFRWKNQTTTLAYRKKRKHIFPVSFSLGTFPQPLTLRKSKRENLYFRQGTWYMRIMQGAERSLLTRNNYCDAPCLEKCCPR